MIVSSASIGVLVYTSGEAMAAVRFDADRLETLGVPVRIPTGGSGEFAVPDEGTLVQVAGANPWLSTLVWVDTTGREDPLGAPPGRYVYPRLSPDQTRVALVPFPRRIGTSGSGTFDGERSSGSPSIRRQTL
jgi:hypothetical protein